MSDLWVYDVDAETVAGLRERATRNGRTVEEEAHAILTRAFAEEGAPPIPTSREPDEGAAAP